MSSEIDLARLAAIIDCEGCISIVKQYNNGSVAGYTYTLRLTVDNSKYILIDWIKYHFGGAVYSNLTVRGKRYYTSTFTGEDAASILRAVFPFLIIKEEQARIALDFQSTIGHYTRSNPIPKVVLADRDQMYIKLRALKIVPVEI